MPKGKSSKTKKPAREKYRNGVKERNKKTKLEKGKKYQEKWLLRRLKKAERLGLELCDVCKRILSKKGVCQRELAGKHK